MFTTISETITKYLHKILSIVAEHLNKNWNIIFLPPFNLNIVHLIGIYASKQNQ